MTKGRSPVQKPYYGWAIVFLAAIAMAATLPGRTHGLGLITKRMIEDIGMSTTAFAYVNLWATLLGALFCLPCGWLIDRLGVRGVVAVVTAGLGAAVVWLSSIDEPRWLLPAITLTRGIGQSMLSVVSITMVGKWFHRRIGPAMGVYSVAMSMTMAIATSAIGALVVRFGWREAWFGLGYGLLILAPVLWFFTRNAPRDASREFPREKLQVDHASLAFGSATLGQALSTSCFWVFSLSIAFFGLASSGLTLFNQYVLEERGFGEGVFHQVLVIGLIVGMAANLVTGWLANSMPLARLLSAAMFVLALSLAYFPFVKSLPAVYCYAVLHGVAGGMITVLFFAVWGHAFGTARLGAIQAATQMLTVFASAAGPLVVASSREIYGSYLQIFAVSAAIAGTLAVVAWFTFVPDVRSGRWSAARLPLAESASKATAS